MRVMVVGGGGREHALCKKIMESPLVSKVYAAPGNPGMADPICRVPYTEREQAQLVEFGLKESIDLVLIGPEQPLVDGLADRFGEAGIKVFAPSSKAAEIEGSKVFAKGFMKRHGIPTADYRVFQESAQAQAYLEGCKPPIVIKADGLAAGKGVIVAETLQEAEQALREMLVERRFGAASARVVIEEFLEGEEFSLMALVHGELVVPLDVSQDHKRAYEGERGPNTGGMGAYSPVPQISPSVVLQGVEQVLEPVARALVAEGRFFSGVLYAGAILTAQGVKVIEFNARWGDPETQVVLPRLQSDLVRSILLLMDGKLPSLDWSPRTMLGVVVASEGYPLKGVGGAVLKGLPESGADRHLYYSGVEENDRGELVSSGGRAFLLGCLGDSLSEAQSEVYQCLAALELPGLFYRKDIGNRAQRHLDKKGFL